MNKMTLYKNTSGIILRTGSLVISSIPLVYMFIYNSVVGHYLFSGGNYIGWMVNSNMVYFAGIIISTCLTGAFEIKKRLLMIAYWPFVLISMGVYYGSILVKRFVNWIITGE